MHLGQLVIDESVRAKLNTKHNISFDEVKEAIQHPARARAKWDNHPVHGRRVAAIGTVASGRAVLCILIPVPEYDENADTWLVKTARWLRSW